MIFDPKPRAAYFPPQLIISPLRIFFSPAKIPKCSFESHQINPRSFSLQSYFVFFLHFFSFWVCFPKSYTQSCSRFLKPSNFDNPRPSMSLALLRAIGLPAPFTACLIFSGPRFDAKYTKGVVGLFPVNDPISTPLKCPWACLAEPGLGQRHEGGGSLLIW